MKSRRDVGTHFRILLGVDSLPGDRIFVSQRANIKAERYGHALDEIEHEEAFELLCKCWFGNRN